MVYSDNTEKLETNTGGKIDSSKPDGSMPSAQDDKPSTAALAFIIIALVSSVFLVALDTTIVTTAVPRITDEFNSLDQVGWYGSSFMITLSAFQSTWGKAYKFFSLKYTFMFSIFIFEIASLLCGVAHNSTTFIVGRAIAGLGAAGIGSGVYTIIAFSVAPERRAAFTGVLGISQGVSSAIGPLIGGAFTTNVSWRWCFYINLPIGGLALAFILVFFRTPKIAQPAKASLKEKIFQMDFPGTFSVLVGAICFILALQWGGVTKPWSDSTVVGTLVGAGLFTVLFVVVELVQKDRAMVIPRILRNRTIAACFAFNFFRGGGYIVLLYYLPIYFQAVDGVTAVASGIRILPLILGISLFTIISGVLITRFGHFAPLLVVGACLCTIGCGLIFTLDIGTPSSHWIGYQALAGIGTGICLQVPIIVAQSIVEPSDISSAISMMLFSQTVGGAFTVSAAQNVFANLLRQRIHEYAPSVSSAQIVTIGATEITSAFPKSEVPGILHAYMDGLQASFAMTLGLVGVATIIAFIPHWTKLKVNLFTKPTDEEAKQ